MAILIFLLALATLVRCCWVSATAHDWYRLECCNNRNCAPVESVTWSVPTAIGQLIVTRHGTAAVPIGFPIRKSKDGRMHVGLRPNEFDSCDVMSLFMPPPA